MRVIKVLGSLVVFACVASAVAADKQVIAQNDAVVAKKANVPAVHAVVKPAAKAKSADQGDSRMNDYALERSSCCGPN